MNQNVLRMAEAILAVLDPKRRSESNTALGIASAMFVLSTRETSVAAQLEPQYCEAIPESPSVVK